LRTRSFWSTYEIVCDKGSPADKLALIKGFLGYTSSTAGQSSIAQLGYATTAGANSAPRSRPTVIEPRLMSLGPAV